MPCIFGGYYYSPLEVQKRSDELFLDKYFESHMVLPRILAESNFKVTVYNQDWMDYNLYNQFENIKAGNNQRNYTKYYLEEFKDFSFRDYYNIYYNNLLRFSFFRISPSFFRKAIYFNADYFSVQEFKYSYSHRTIDSYSSLYYLQDITEITDKDENYATMFVNELTHRYSFMEMPDYKPSNNIQNNGESSLIKDDNYHVHMAAFLLLAKWFRFCKENNVYNNTKIIIVSDHGRNFESPFPDRIILPHGDHIDGFTAFLMVKDLNADSDFKIDNTFMTNADVPHVVTDGLIENVINPFTGIELPIGKTDGATITTTTLWSLSDQNKYTFKIKPDEWLHVHDNIYDLENWSSVTIEQ
jgi:hypothetical protein